ncbi:hypothetical protein A3J61_01740 [Candidatus Nomurabacteria bacterium RIFCSPHIGHO2_02_FULL_38_15]|uniref:Putative pre-16S rRNA nuclease n=1 Tax=Candidatus Nomurabacteria bacterium RIFCSPHIGHO2_02_FULL_38_15 TaxID=1801752 RepID=A0A1F6VQK6_9BACT|nr:MAG: hypothetical protein A3J61_01740 [Candidatus Nomurabacteria bacterium RIFCSPHIGHO2_02_FULL_38_15]
MKYLGIDYGTKRVGLAVSDEMGIIATPFETVLTGRFLSVLPQIIKQNNIKKIVFGRSVNTDGDANVLQAKIDNVILEIENSFDIEIELQNESLSSVVAHGHLGKNQLNAKKVKLKKVTNLDAKAAAVILQRYLDKINKNK